MRRLVQMAVVGIVAGLIAGCGGGGGTSGGGTGGGSSSSTSNFTCCVNGSFYTCPNAAAVEMCITSTSACTRTPSKDTECN